MTQVVAIQVADVNNPVEVNSWLSGNPNATFNGATVQGNVFYVFYS